MSCRNQDCDSKNILPKIRRHFLSIAAKNTIGGFCKGSCPEKQYFTTHTNLHLT